MPKMPFNNDDLLRVEVGEPDAHGQAALMLAESTLHALIEIGALSVHQAIEVVSTALELKRELAESAGESRATMNKSLALLRTISASLKSDLTPSRAA